MRFLQKIKDKFTDLIRKVKTKIQSNRFDINPLNIIVDKTGTSYFVLKEYDSDNKSYKFKGFILARVYHNRSTLGEVLTKLAIDRRYQWSAYIRDILEYGIPISEVELNESDMVYVLQPENEGPLLEQFENLFDRKMGESMSNIGASITAEDADHINPNSLMTYQLSIIDRCLINKEFIERFYKWDLAVFCS